MVSKGYIKCVEYCEQVKNSNNAYVFSSISNKLIKGYFARVIDCILACFLLGVHKKWHKLDIFDWP